LVESILPQQHVSPHCIGRCHYANKKTLQGRARRQAMGRERSRYNGVVCPAAQVNLVAA
jgi:hypothetical protein